MPYIFLCNKMKNTNNDNNQWERVFYYHFHYHHHYQKCVSSIQPPSVHLRSISLTLIYLQLFHFTSSLPKVVKPSYLHSWLNWTNWLEAHTKSTQTLVLDPFCLPNINVVGLCSKWVPGNSSIAMELAIPKTSVRSCGSHETSPDVSGSLAGAAPIHLCCHRLCFSILWGRHRADRWRRRRCRDENTCHDRWPGGGIHRCTFTNIKVDHINSRWMPVFRLHEDNSQFIDDLRNYGMVMFHAYARWILPTNNVAK